MKKSRKDNISKNTVYLILILIIVYFVAYLIYPNIIDVVKKIITPEIQKQYYVSSTLSNENREVAKGITAEDAYIVPLSNAIALLIIMLLIFVTANRLIRKLYDKGITFTGMHKIVKLLEITLIFAGIFVFVYKLNSIDTKYGIYKDVFNDTSDLSYYPVEELPVAVDYLHDDINIFGKIQMFLILNSDIIVRLLEIIVAISGALLLPLKYCVERENENKKKQEYKKMKSDVISQVIENLNRKSQKEKKL